MSGGTMRVGKNLARPNGFEVDTGIGGEIKINLMTALNSQKGSIINCSVLEVHINLFYMNPQLSC